MNLRLWCVFAIALTLFVLALLVGCASPVPSPSCSVPPEQALRLARQIAREIGGNYYTVSGSSMRPFLSERAIVVIESTSFDWLKAGDVVVYRTKHLHTFVHRITKWTERGWVVAGDANGYNDAELVTRSNFIGRQCAVFFTQ